MIRKPPQRQQPQQQQPRQPSQPPQYNGAAFAPGFRPSLDDIEQANNSSKRKRKSSPASAVENPRNDKQAEAPTAKKNPPKESSEAATAKKNPPKEPAEDKTPKVNKRLKELIGCHFFPKVDKEGHLFVTTGPGIAQRQTMANEIQAGNHLKQYFPHRPLYHFPRPEDRALAIKGNEEWTAEKIHRAAECFHVVGTTLMIYPDIFDRDELKGDNRFTMKNGDKPDGIKTPCPYCSSNKFVTFHSWNITKWPNRRVRRSINCDSTSYDILGARLVCRNAECVGAPPKMDENGNEVRNKKRWERDSEKASQHQFAVWTKDCFSLFPPSVRAKYEQFVNGIGLNEDYTTFASMSLVHQLLDDQKTLVQLAGELSGAHDTQRLMAEMTYVNFVKTHGLIESRQTTITAYFPSAKATNEETSAQTSSSKEQQALWPRFDRAAFDKEYGPPKDDAVETLYWIAFKMVRPYLMRDLLSRTPGRGLSWDGTYQLAKKTMSDLLTGETSNVLCIMWGEYGHVISYAWAKQETPKNWQRMHWNLKKRCDKIGNGATQAVVYGYSDLCCEGWNDVTKHWFPQIWPNVKSAPKRDMFHALKMVTDATFGNKHPLHNKFCADLAQTVLPYSEASIKQVLPLVKKENPAFTEETCREVALKSGSKWKTKLKRYVVERNEGDADVRALYRQLKEDDKQLKARGDAPRSYIKKAVQGFQRGTDFEVENFLNHWNKGCCEDPLPPEDMCYEIPSTTDDSLNDVKTRRGTSGGEQCNKLINRTGQNATRMGLPLADSKCLLRFVRFNKAKDALVEHLTGVAPKAPLWYLEEALQEYYISMHGRFREDPTGNAVFPPKDVPKEAIGVDFLRQMEDAFDEEFLRHKQQGATNFAEIPQSPLVPGEPDSPIPNETDSPVGFSTTDTQNNPENGTGDQMDQGSATNPSGTCTPRAKTYYSAGATTWNRKETVRSPISPARFQVRYPLTGAQIQIAAQLFVDSFQKKPSELSKQQLAQQLFRDWNEGHTKCLASGKRGFGGFLTEDVALKFVKDMTAAAIKDVIETHREQNDQIGLVPIMPRFGWGMGTGIQHGPSQVVATINNGQNSAEIQRGTSPVVATNNSGQNRADAVVGILPRPSLPTVTPNIRPIARRRCERRSTNLVTGETRQQLITEIMEHGLENMTTRDAYEYLKLLGGPCPSTKKQRIAALRDVLAANDINDDH